MCGGNRGGLLLCRVGNVFVSGGMYEVVVWLDRMKIEWLNNEFESVCCVCVNDTIYKDENV